MRAALLAASLLLAVPCPAAADTRDEWVALSLASGRVIQAQLRFPAGGGEGPLPTLMLFGGFRSAASTLDLVKTDERLLLASFDYPYDPPRKFIFPQGLGHLPEFKQAIRETFEGIELLHAHLRQRADVDPARITIAGASAGAPFATIAAAGANIPGLVIVQGFGLTRAVVAQQFIRRWEPKYGGWTRWPAQLLARFAAWYLELPDADQHARQLRPAQRVLMVTATADDFIPKPASDALAQALRASGTQVDFLQLEGGHLRSSSDEQISDILSRSMVWMRSVGLI